MKVTRAVIVGILLLSSSFWTQSAAAIEKLRIYRGILVLEGKIDRGDYATIRTFLSDESNFKQLSGEVFLASGGGSVSDALEIGYLIRRLQLSTDAPSNPPPSVKGFGQSVIRASDLFNQGNYQCSSACFLVYVAGIHRNLIWAGRLGIHRPRIEHKPIGISENGLSAGLEDMRNKIKLYFQEMNVPSKYLDLMFSVPSNQIHWLSQSEVDSELKGYIPEVQSLLDSKCRSPGDDRSNEMRCTAAVKNQLRAEAWRKIFHRD
jgi:hypothetical protein